MQPATAPLSALGTKRLLTFVLRRFLLDGSLTVIWPDRSTTTLGNGGPHAGFRLATWHAARRMITDPGLALGECYMDGTLTPQACTLPELLDLIGLNLPRAINRVPGIALSNAIGHLRRRLDQWNPARRAARNVAHHYDIDCAIYQTFLDADMQYSCAYFATGQESLDAAQDAKKRLIATKLCLTRPGLSVLDIGCGWGGLALTLARHYGARVTGITLSREQCAHAMRRAEAAGLTDRVRFELRDYRAIAGQFDRVVSVGMFEHVGVTQYPAFFRAAASALAPDGVGLLHTIGRLDGPAHTNRWLTRYIFPGGYAPALSEIMPPFEQSGLVLTDLEVLRGHYAETLRHWQRRFAAHRAEVAARKDERFCRMWEFYLALSELAFTRLGSAVFHVQFAHAPDAVPPTRAYLLQALA